MSSVTLKRPRAGACATCRSRKRRCIPASAWDGCQLCRSLSVPCSLSRSSGSRHSVHTVAPVPAVAESPDALPAEESGLGALGSQELLLELVPLYFHFIHDIAHTMFHEPSFMRRLHDGKGSRIHVYAMCALAARFSDNRVFANIPPCARGQIYAAEAIRLCQQRMVSPSLETVQGFLLIGYFFSGEGSIQGRHVYVGLARLHAETLPRLVSPDPVRREEYRRTWLTVHIATHWSASELAMEPASISRDHDFFPEVDDVDFRSLSPELISETPGSPSSRCNLWAQMAQTLNIFTKINVLLRQLSRNVIRFDDYCREAAVLEEQLDQWATDLAPSLVYSFDNFMLLVGKHIGQTFLAMHIGYYHFRQMLFFPFLDSRVAPRTTGDKAAKCKDSAIIVSDILRYSKSVKNCEMDYFLYGHIAVVSSCVHLHTLLFSDDQVELSLARQRLVFNFQYLMNLKSYWPVVDHHVTHLRTFQNFCRDSMSDPFVLDNWMARFLTEHSSALSDRRLAGAQPSTLDVPAPGMPTAPYPVPVSGTTSQDRAMDNPESASRDEVSQPITEWHDLSRLLNDQGMTGEAIVNSALDWLLDDHLETDRTL